MAILMSFFGKKSTFWEILSWKFQKIYNLVVIIQQTLSHWFLKILKNANYSIYIIWGYVFWPLFSHYFTKRTEICYGTSGDYSEFFFSIIDRLGMKIRDLSTYIQILYFWRGNGRGRLLAPKGLGSGGSVSYRSTVWTFWLNNYIQ